MLGLGGKLKGASHPIGIAVTGKDVCLAQAVPGSSSGRSGGRYVFEREPLNDDVAVTDPNFHTEVQRALATALRRGKFVGKQAVSALPAELLRYKTLRLPPMPEEDLAQAVAWEASERFELTENESLQYYRAGQVNQGSEKREEVILLAADRTALHDHASAVQQAGLQPIAIDASGSALTRVLGDPGRSTLTIHLGESIAEIVGHRGEQVLFDKPINLTRHGQVIDVPALGREVGLCLRYLSVTFGVHKPDAAWLAGQNVSESLAMQLGESLGLMLKTADQSTALSGAGLPEPNPAQWCVAVGLAERNRVSGLTRGEAA